MSRALDLALYPRTLTIDSNLDMKVKGTKITLNIDEAGAPTEDAVIEVERGSSNNAIIRYNETDNNWEFTNDGITFANILGSVDGVALGTDTTGDYVQSLVAGALVDLQNNSGESATPTIDVDLSELTDMTDAAVGTDEMVILDAGVQKRKALNEITLGLFNTADQIALSTDTTGNYVQQGATSGNGISGSVNSEGGTFTVTSNATDANTASTIVFRDASGNFSAGTITATLSGNATSATTASGVAANSVALGGDTTGNYVATIAGTANEVEVSGSGSETAAVTIGLPNDVTIGNDLTVTGALNGPASFTIDPAAVGDDTGTVIIAGNLTVNGTTTTVNSNTVEIGDSIITLNSDEAGTPSQNAGIEVERGTSTNVQFRWNETNDKWEVTEDGAAYSNILTTADEGTGNGLDADTVDGIEAAAITQSGDTVALTGDVTGSTTVAADGAISIATTIAANSVALGGDTTGNYVATVAGTANEVEVSGSGSETAAVTIGLPNDVTIGNELTVTTGLFTPLIDTADSSALTVTPAAVFSSDVTVENNFTVQTNALFVTSEKKIGAGTVSPSYNLHINDTAAGGNKFGITAPGGTEPNFVMQGDDEQTFRFYNTAAAGSTRVSWKMANRNNVDWEYIMFTDIDQDGTESFQLQGRTAGNTLTLRDGGLSTTGTFTATGVITGPTTDTLLIKNSAGTTLKTIRGV